MTCDGTEAIPAPFQKDNPSPGAERTPYVIAGNSAVIAGDGAVGQHYSTQVCEGTVSTGAAATRGVRTVRTVTLMCVVLIVIIISVTTSQTTSALLCVLLVLISIRWIVGCQ